jgi:hypothetical protein
MARLIQGMAGDDCRPCCDPQYQGIASPPLSATAPTEATPYCELIVSMQKEVATAAIGLRVALQFPGRGS